ncbi:histidinol-phosphate transaminase [Cellulomonas carbonis]|uniref:Aromatic amino acid aminotransferase n=1 Tax=Cellulomonas carbonis T26 TaxID=947969 RepID=A0A0A0BV16_9CELL|nr:histidinol-phosphate transaminase [Cellulomonas carbonis]KGM11557.1 aminotransferase [Cellulomonas carbonis T26]
MTSPVPFRAVVDSLPAYVPGARGADPDAHKLSSNENPFPPLASVRAAVERAASELHRYPDMFATALGEALAARHGVDPSGIVASTGSVAVLGHVLQAFCDAGDEVVHAWRSFEAYPILVQLQGAVSVRVPVTADGRHDLDAMAAAISPRTRVVLLCTPNNPTGPALTHTEVLSFLDRVPPTVLVVLDEAYVEFVRQDDPLRSGAVLAAYPNVVVLRTFSKAYGLAALRVGYAVTSPDIARGIRTASTPFGVNHLAQVGALASLDAEDELLERVDAVVAERTRVLAGLRAQGWTVPESQGNFVWLETGARTTEIAVEAAAAGVLVRPFAGEGIRITIGTPEADDRVLELAAGWL